MPPVPARSFTPLAEQLHRLAIQLLRGLRVEDARSGIPPARLSALSVLVFGGPRSLGALADAEQVRPPTMSRIVDGLVGDGLATRTADEHDARVIRISATAKGKRVLLAGRDRRVARLSASLAALTEEDRAKLTEALTPLTRTIAAMTAKRDD
jgi:DNA-binding MarR family transcriptional regulator